MRLPACVVLLGLCVGTALPARAQSTSANSQSEVRALAESDYEAVRLKKIVTAVRIDSDITLDGRLDEPAWALASPASDFIQRAPLTGMPSGERTEVRILYDDDNLYFGVTCYDSQPTRMIVKELKKDFDLNGTDVVQVIIDSLHDPAAREQVSPQSLNFDNVLGIVAGRPQSSIGRRSRFGRYRQVIPLVF